MTTRICIPKNATEINRDGLPGTVYSYTSESGKLCAIAYKAKAYRPTWHYNFKTEEQRQHRIDEFFNDLKTHVEAMRERKQERTGFNHTLKPGDILYHSYGYDQTNIHFFQVIATTAKTVTFREVCQTHSGLQPLGDSWTTVPNVGQFKTDEKEYTRTVSEGNRVNFSRYPGGMTHRLNPWDGRPMYASDGH